MTAVAGRRRTALRSSLVALPWFVAAASVAGFAAAWILAVHNRDALHIGANSGPDRFLLAYPIVGAVLASRRRSNPVGWFLLGMGLVSACRGLAGEYALDTLTRTARPEAGVWTAWFVGWALTLVFPGGLLLFLLLLFPDGRPLTPRWWAVGWLAAGLSAVYLVVDWLVPGSVTLGPGCPACPTRPASGPGATCRAAVPWATAFGSWASRACWWPRRAWFSGTDGQLMRSGCSSNGSLTPPR